MVLFRAVDIGADLFAITAACVRAQMLSKRGNREAVTLADVFCREARLRVADNFRNFYGKADKALSRAAKQVLAGEHRWLEQGIVGFGAEDARAAGTAPADPMAKTLRREAAGVGD
jgi:hypothetical protein